MMESGDTCVCVAEEVKGQAEKSRERYEQTTEKTPLTEQEEADGASESDCANNMSETKSVVDNHGEWEGHDDPWCGCVCKQTHPRPTEVFWTQCDGLCQAWYNVAVDCVGFDAKQAESMSSWICRKCSSISPQVGLLLNLPDELFHCVLSFVAPPMGRASVLCHQLAPLCRATHYAVQTKPGLWTFLLNSDCRGGTSLDKRARWGSKRRRLASLDVQVLVQEAHTAMCQNTEDAMYSYC